MNARKPSVYKLIAFGLNSFHFYPAIYICTYSVVQFGRSRGTRATFQPSSSIFQACFAASLPSKSFPPFSIFFSICLRNLRSAIFTNTSVEWITGLSGWQEQSMGLFSGFPTPLTFRWQTQAVQKQQIQPRAEGIATSAYEAPLTDCFEKQPAVPFVH